MANDLIRFMDDFVVARLWVTLYSCRVGWIRRH